VAIRATFYTDHPKTDHRVAQHGNESHLPPLCGHRVRSQLGVIIGLVPALTPASAA
jgi:hypothetical protein